MPNSLSTLYSSRVVLVLCLFLLGVAAGQGRAGEVIYRHEIRKEAAAKDQSPGLLEISLTVESVFGPGAPQGIIPYRVTFRNQSRATRTCTLHIRESISDKQKGTSITTQMRAESGEETVREIYFPQSSNENDRYSSLQIRFESTVPGLDSHSGTTYARTDLSAGFPWLAMSNALALKNLPSLNAEATAMDSSISQFAEAFDPTALPTQWRGYTSLDSLLIDLPTWEGLLNTQRQAILTWVRLGGSLDVYYDPSDPRSDPLPPPLNLLPRPSTPTSQGAEANEKSSDSPPAKAERFGMGVIQLCAFSGETLPAKAVVQHYRDRAQHSTVYSRPLTQVLEDDFRLNSESWGLTNEINLSPRSPKLALIFLAIFAILVAPVNLFWLAGSGRRHRLFITTPVISLAASLMIIASIFLIDGFGGKGVRAVLVDLQSDTDEMRSYTVQEQISRTGVMLDTGFTTKQRYEITPVARNFTEPHGFPSSINREIMNGNLAFNGDKFSGDFFRSRALQAYSLRNSEPNRSRIELQGEESGTPILVSSLPTRIEALCYRDGKGKDWILPTGKVVEPGARIPLESTDDRELPDWAQEIISQFSATRQKQIHGLRERNRFYAKIADPASFVLATHPSIHWEKTLLLLTGSTAIQSKSEEKPVPKS